jgi:hypothetical protein
MVQFVLFPECWDYVLKPVVPVIEEVINQDGD